jgi:magnesium-dependent phosphatase 1
LYDVGEYQEIYPGSKLKHFKTIHQESGVAYEDMLFFDNERWNITGACGGACVGAAAAAANAASLQ